MDPAKLPDEAPALEVLERTGITFTAQGMEFERRLSVAEARDVWQSLAALSEACNWAFGDLMIHCDCHSAEHWQAINPDGRYDYAICRQWRTVASKYPRHRRRPGLTFTHHRICMQMEPGLADRWLDMAESQGWTSTQLKDNIAAALGEHEKEAYRRIQAGEMPAVLAKEFLSKHNDHQEMDMGERRRALEAAGVVVGIGPESIPKDRDTSDAQFAVDRAVAIDPSTGILLPLAPAIVPSGRVDRMLDREGREAGGVMVMVSLSGDSYVARICLGEEPPVEGFDSRGPLMAVYAALDRLKERQDADQSAA